MNDLYTYGMNAKSKAVARRRGRKAVQAAVAARTNGAGRGGFAYEQVAADLRAKIEHGDYPPGQQLPPENELATHYRIARRTVRQALALVEAAGLVQRQQGRGTFVRGQRPANGNGKLLFYFGTHTDHFFGDLFLAVSGECQQRHWRASPFDPEKTELNATARAALGQDLAGAVGVICLQAQWPTLAPLLPAGAPRPVFIALHPKRPAAPGYCVSVDRLRAGALATEHLLELGHRRIAFVGTWPEERTTQAYPPPVRDNPCYQGYRLALDNAGVAEQRAWGTYLAVDDAGTEQMAAWLTSLGDWPTAVVADADYLAVIALRALARQGRTVPGAVSVVGLGDTPWSRVSTPALTTVSFDESALARLAVSLVQGAPPAQPTTVLVEPHLVRRASTAAPPTP